jgi:hypothetical protein
MNGRVVVCLLVLLQACASGDRVGRTTFRSDASALRDAGGGSGDGGGRDAGAIDASSFDAGRAPPCADGFRNGDESDVDCGGSCGACADSQRCAAADDCASRVCAGGLCQVPGCADGVHNGDESDADCGGSCDPCAGGAACGDDADCESGSCAAGTCASPACDDGVRNGTETDTDCGGGCPGSANGGACTMGSDCVSGTCTAGACASPPSVTVEFPSATSTVCSAGTCGSLGAGGGGRYYRTGDYVEQSFTGTGLGSITQLAVMFDMDDVTSGCAVGLPLDWNVLVNGRVVGTYGYTGGSSMGRFTISRTYTFSAVSGAGTGDQYTLRTVCPGGASWNWFPGGMATLSL